jgi:ketosteroid isomerase-like protein
MSRLRLVEVVSMVGVLALTACQSAPRPAADTEAPAAAAAAAPLTDADLAAMRANDSAFAAAATAGNVDGVVATYAADASLLPPNAPRVNGADAIRGFWGGFMAAYDLKMEVVGDEAEGRGDLAYVVGRYRFTATPKDKGAAMQDAGKFVEVYKRQADGSWKYAVDIYNSDLPVK